jgi:SAM-dependent methyltransferase
MSQAGEQVSWSDLTRWRAECHRRFGAILDLPIVDLGAELRSMAGAASSVLDVGAGKELPLKAFVDTASTAYRSLDSDPSGTFDYAHVSEIPAGERFDLAVANQLLEHLTIPEAIETVAGVGRVLAPGGRFAATVPNPSHPVRYWADATHVTPWPINDLYGLFRESGLEVERLVRYGKRRLPWRPLRRMIVKTVATELRVDWCDSLLIVGRPPGG